MFDFKRKLTLRQMYGFLLEQCREFKRTNTKKPDKDRINRSCNKYVIKHVVNVWRKQYEI